MNASRASEERHPIGYWLKLVDRLIDQGFDAVLGSAAVTPRHWQILNLLESGPATYAHIDDEAALYLAPHMPTVRPVVDDLVNRGWATTVGTDRVALTDTGLKALTDIQAAVSADRDRVTEGISEDEYRVAVDVLMRMATNLGWREERDMGPV
ncbi:MarR family winged helix-turn-helix transcriptional regulator [Jiangella asiatica]|uniref:MarR family transcriptional regulator n=1 Tax=Jiangella asiatica TaxID=2530372 RepID=A0A4R5CR69_9ACTN|nr:MarR family winged helix-turn-helix transcriptional regulator [Jiangella asiatica]TDE01321.1 MarR family transcriptional regulator [Jiangella asiatica]